MKMDNGFLETKDIFDYLENLKDRLKESSKRRQSVLHCELARKLNQENYQQLVGQIINAPRGLKLVTELIDSIDYHLIYSKKNHFELAYFYKSIKDLCRVSIVVPVYNVEAYLSECLESLINQTWKNMEIICINDASTDDSLKILEQYQQKDSRIIIYDNKVNRGLSYARNVGIQKCDSEYIMFVDSDDWLPRNAVEDMYYSMTVPGVDWTVGSIEIYEDILSDVKEKEDQKKYMAHFCHETGLYECPKDIGSFILTSAWGKLYKLSIILQNKIDFPVGLIHEDQSWIWEYGLYCRKLFYLNQPVYVHRVNETSLTHVQDKDNHFLRNLLLVHIFLYQRLSKRACIKEYNGYLARFFVSRIWFSARKSDCRINTKIYALFKKYIRLNPEMKKYIFFKISHLNKITNFAQIDLQNSGNNKNSLSVVSNEKGISYTKEENPNGQKWILQKLPYHCSFVVTAYGAGELKISLRSQDFYDKQKIPVIFESVLINGKRFLKKKETVLHDKCVELIRPVQDQEKLFVKIKYKPSKNSYQELKSWDYFVLKMKEKPVLYVRFL